MRTPTMRRKKADGSSILTACILIQGILIFLLWLVTDLHAEFLFFQRWIGPVSVGLLPVSLLTVDAGLLLMADRMGWLRISFDRETFLDAMETLSPYLGLLGTVISIILATSHWDLVQDAQSVLRQVMGSISAGLGSTVYGLIVALLARVFRYLFKTLEEAV